jgi:Tfp pilus assembly protein FimT
MKSGATLSELLLVLIIIAILGGMALPAARNSLDIVRVRAARETLFGAFMRARSLAMTRGGAALVIDADSDLVFVDVDSTSRQLLDADVTLDGQRRIALRFDAFGIGRMTARTIHLQRRSASASLTVSAYGRVRR